MSSRIVLANEFTLNGETSYEVISDASNFFEEKAALQREIERLTAVLSSNTSEVVEEEKPTSAKSTKSVKSAKKSKSATPKKSAKKSKSATPKKSAKKSPVTEEDKLKKFAKKLQKVFKDYNHNIITENLEEEKIFTIECQDGSYKTTEECLQELEEILKKAFNRSGLKMDGDLECEEEEGFVVLCKVELKPATAKKSTKKKTPTKKKTAKKEKTPTVKKEKKTTKKTTAKKERKSPEESAKDFDEGHEMEGKDGNMWVVKADKNGRKRWAKKSATKKKTSPKKKTAKKEKKTTAKKSAKKPKKVKTPEPEPKPESPKEPVTKQLRSDGDYKDMDKATKKLLKVLMNKTETKWESSYEDNHNGVIDLQTGEKVNEKTVKKLIAKVMEKYGNDEEYQVDCQKMDDGLMVYIDVPGWKQE